jgi:hypothetical protein
VRASWLPIGEEAMRKAVEIKFDASVKLAGNRLSSA